MCVCVCVLQPALLSLGGPPLIPPCWSSLCSIYMNSDNRLPAPPPWELVCFSLPGFDLNKLRRALRAPPPTRELVFIILIITCLRRVFRSRRFLKQQEETDQSFKLEGRG